MELALLVNTQGGNTVTNVLPLPRHDPARLASFKRPSIVTSYNERQPTDWHKCERRRARASMIVIRCRRAGLGTRNTDEYTSKHDRLQMRDDRAQMGTVTGRCQRDCQQTSTIECEWASTKQCRCRYGGTGQCGPA
jgi:hypothetical protein